MDFDLWCEMAKVTRFRHIPAFLGCFREHDSAKSVVAHGADDRAAAFLEEHRRVYRKHFGRDLPGPLAARFYRLLHKARFARECLTRARREEVHRLRHLMAASPNPCSSVSIGG